MRFYLCEGTDFVSATTSVEFDINASIIKNLSCPVLLVANAYQKPIEEVSRLINLTLESLVEKGCKIVGTIINRVTAPTEDDIILRIKAAGLVRNQLIYAIPDEAVLAKPTLAEVAKTLNAEILCGHKQMYRHARSFTVAAMQLRNMLPRITHGTLVITPRDRADIIVACLADLSSASMEKISGIVLTGGLKPEKPIWDLIQGFSDMVPVLSVDADTFETAVLVEKIQSDISPSDERKITRALALFEQHIDIERLGEKVITTKSTIVTPKMFEFKMIQRARAHRKRIVLPEGTENRILLAAETLLRREIVDITLLGDQKKIQQKIAKLGLRMPKVEIIDPLISTFLDLYTATILN